MSIFNKMKPQGGTSLHPFDLSRRDIFSVKSCVLTPNFIQHTVPESKYDVSHAQITRMDPIQTAAFARLSENYEYYFVPYSQIYKDFEHLYYERGDVQRNGAGISYGSNYQMSDIVPNFSYRAVVSRLTGFFVVSRLYAQMLAQDSSYAKSLAADMYANFNEADMLNADLPFDVHGEVCIDEMIKLFDMLGYGNLYSVFNSLISPFFAFDVPQIPDGLPKYPDYPDLEQIPEVNAINRQFVITLMQIYKCYYDDPDGLPTVENWSDFTAENVKGLYSDFFAMIYDVFHLIADDHGEVEPYWRSKNLTWFHSLSTSIADYFMNDGSSEYPLVKNFILQFDNDNGGANRYPSIFALAAYVKVFADIYRNSQFDTNYYAALFNFDYVDSDQNATVPLKVVLQMLLPRFRQYKKDIFTGVFPNAQFGSVAVSSLTNPASLYATDYSSSNSNNFLYAERGLDGKIGLASTNLNPYQQTSFRLETGVSALAIRQALSLQRYKERILRAGNRLTALQNAVFGDRSRFIENNYVQFIGAEKNNIDINSVAATSDAGLSEVGQLGGNGVGTHVGKAFEFHSHDFGIIIGIYYILPESEYEAYMIDPMNTKTESNDFYKPDFMNLGLSPVFNYNFNILGNFDNLDHSLVLDKVLGYLANYWEYKTSLDKVHGNFYCSLPNLRYDGNGDLSLPGVSTAAAYLRGQNSYYVTPRSAAAYRSSLTLGQLYANPHDIDSIFYVNSDFRMDTDQFKINCNHDVKALLPMSVVGLPEY